MKTFICLLTFTLLIGIHPGLALETIANVVWDTSLDVSSDDTPLPASQLDLDVSVGQKYYFLNGNLQLQQGGVFACAGSGYDDGETVFATLHCGNFYLNLEVAISTLSGSVLFVHPTAFVIDNAPLTLNTVN